VPDTDTKRFLNVHDHLCEDLRKSAFLRPSECGHVRISTRNIKFESTFHWLRASFLGRVACGQIFDITEWQETELALQVST